MGPIRAQFWLPSAPLASWTRRIWRKTDRASGIGPIPRSKMAIFLSYGPTSPVSLSEPMTIERLILRGRSGGRRSQFRDHSQDVGEEVFRNVDLGHLECNVATRADDLRADLDQLLLQAGQRPILDRLRRRQRAQEIAEIVGQRVKLKSNSVGRERPT